MNTATNPDPARIENAAQRANLGPPTARLFKAYMQARFPDAHPDYLDKWAERFAKGTAYVYSDFDGRNVLIRLIRLTNGVL